MTDPIMAFIDYLRKEGLVEDIDFLREASEFRYQQLIDLEAEEVIGAGQYEDGTQACLVELGGKSFSLDIGAWHFEVAGGKVPGGLLKINPVYLL